jgi:hypothetical protein
LIAIGKNIPAVFLRMGLELFSYAQKLSSCLGELVCWEVVSFMEDLFHARLFTGRKEGGLAGVWPALLRAGWALTARRSLWETHKPQNWLTFHALKGVLVGRLQKG